MQAHPRVQPDGCARPRANRGRRTPACHGAGVMGCVGRTAEKSGRMDTMEVNKGIAAVLVVGIVFFLTGLIGDKLVTVTEPSKPALKIESVAATASTPAA